MLSHLIPIFVFLISKQPILFSPTFNFTMEGIIFFLIGAVCLYLAFKIRLKEKKISRNGLHAEGIVIDFVVDNMTKDLVLQFPVVRFVTLKEESITERYDITAPSLLNKGQKVDIVYNPDNPK